MSGQGGKARLRGLVPLVIVAAALVSAAVFRGELVAWFRGEAPASDATTAHGEDASEDDDAIAHYTCAMHPSVRSDGPGQCPICSMDLIAVTHGEIRSGVLRVDGERTQRIGVRYATVHRERLSRAVAAVGEVNPDENRLTDVTLRTAGWIDRLHVEETGEYVRRGQPLLALYSPDVLAASEEVLAARRASGTVRDRLAAAADRKLRLLGVSKGQLQRLVVRGKARDRITVTAPAGGYVVDKLVVEGDYVEQGATLLRIADLSVVWVDAQVYESDLPLVKPGQPVSVTLAFVPGKQFAGKVDYVHPRLDPQTRTVPVRVVLDNPDLVLRPGMYADVRIDVDLGERRVIPQEAVIYAGPRRLVFLDLGDGRLQPKEVRLGVAASGLVEVVEGLVEGERVVASGNFLIAAESRIRSATTIWASEPATEAAPDDTPPVADDEHDHATGGPHYTCPMHKEVHAHEAGRCPICGMDLELREESRTDRSPSTEAEDRRPGQRRRSTSSTQRGRASAEAPKSRRKPAPAPSSEPESKTSAPKTTRPQATESEPRAPKKAAPVQYTCPMHRQIVRDTPGTCPICKMKLVRKGGER